MLKINDKVVYPGLGVASVQEIVMKKVLNKNINFFKLVFLYKDMTILVPEYNLSVIGVREPSSEETLKKLLAEIRKKIEKKIVSADLHPSAWNRRQKEYQLKIQGGNIFDLGKIYRELMVSFQHKELSFGEKALLQLTENLIAQEMQVSLELEKEKVYHYLRLSFKQLPLESSEPQEIHQPQPGATPITL